MSIEGLQAQLRVFCSEREWEPFNTPKNLVMALTGEVGELTETALNAKMIKNARKYPVEPG